MAQFSATNTLTNYIQESELGDLDTCNTLDSMDINSINKQLNDLTIQFKHSMQKFQPKDLSTPSLKPSFSMPQLPLFCDPKMHRKKAKLLSTNISHDCKTFNPLNMRALHVMNATESGSVSSSSLTTQSSTENSNENMKVNLNTYRNNEHDHNHEINQKLDLLIHIINSQQNLLQKLIKKTNKKKKVKTKTKSTQTSIDTNNSVSIPHIVSSDAPNFQQSPVTSYPPIPQSQSQTVVSSNQNVSVPCDMLLKLLNAVTNNKAIETPQPQRQYPYEYGSLAPMNQPYSHPPPPPVPPMPNDNNNNNQKHLMSPKSTLYFSD